MRPADARMTPRRRDSTRNAGGPQPESDRARAARLSSIVKFSGHLATLSREDDIILALLQAAAVWYDLDARAYRRDNTKRLILRTALPGANLSDCPAELLDCPSTPVRVSSLVELTQLGWQNPSGSVLLLPIVVGTETEWVVSVIGAAEDEAELELASLCAVIGTLFDRLGAVRADALNTRFAETLGARAASPPEIATALLSRLASTVSAVQAGFWMTHEENKTTELAMVGPWLAAPATTRDFEPSVHADRIVMPLMIGASPIGGIDLRSAPDAPFTPEHGALVAAGAASLRLWLGGLRAGGKLEATGTLAASDFEARLREEIERAKRFGLPIGLLVFTTPVSPGRRPAPDQLGNLLRELRAQLRACDVVGSLDQGDLAVFFAHTDARGLAAALGRISERLDVMSRRSQFPPLRIGRAVYPSHAESAAELLIQARLAAQQPAGSIM